MRESMNMWHGVVWLVTACLLGLWSLSAWVLHAVAQWAAGLSVAKAAGAAGGLADAAHQVGAIRPPEWLAAWLPSGELEQWSATVAAFTPWVETAMSQAPSLVAWLAPAIWLGWALGGVMLLALGIGLSALIGVVQRQQHQHQHQRRSSQPAI